MDGWYNVKSKAKGRKDFVSKCDITKVTPHMIAYAALQVLHPIWHTLVLTALLTDIYRIVVDEAMGC